MGYKNLISIGTDQRGIYIGETIGLCGTPKLVPWSKVRAMNDWNSMLNTVKRVNVAGITVGLYEQNYRQLQIASWLGLPGAPPPCRNVRHHGNPIFSIGISPAVF